MLKKGLYEQLINTFTSEELSNSQYHSETAPVDNAEAPKILAQYLSGILESSLRDEADLSKQIKLINSIVELVKKYNIKRMEGMEIDAKGELLLALAEKQNSIIALNEKDQIVRPKTSISISSLFTGAVHEPSMVSELKKEILSCDRIDMLVSFIKWSGLRLIIEELRTFTQKGGILRIITTSYMGATDVKAVEELRKLQNTQISISYDTKRTRLHAKTYVFYRETGYTTAYVGSSNLSNAAISDGLEWNVKITAKDLPDTIKKIEATFESYLSSKEFEYYSESHVLRLQKALVAEKSYNTNSFQYMFDIFPYPYQQEILDSIRAEREVRGHYKNLVVAATGTGKTVISAFDYKRFAKNSEKNRLLFVAHREEILLQSIECFRGVLKDENFGELFVGNQKPQSIEHLFVSIQTFNSQTLDEKTSADFYDYIIIDEFHHAAAPTYQKILTYYKPKILLGLTATPERMDNKSILEYFDNRIAAEIRLPEAINRKLLCPFQYFGVSDTVDLTTLKWSRGGYDKTELSNVYTLDLAAANKRAQLIITSTEKYVTDIREVKGLGFCVSVAHAEFMAQYFSKYNIPSICITGNSDDEIRKSAKRRLACGEINFIFTVDVFNEGVDIPQINTVLFLRPTESLTVFLQQLGRGLRLYDNKECLTVLDFIGQANKKYNFEDKFNALLDYSAKNVQKELKDGFVSVPKGCYIQLEKRAKEYILANIKNSFGTRDGLVSKISTFEEDSELELNLKNFTEYYHLDVRNIYKKSSFSRLCVYAGVIEDFCEEDENIITKALTRICAINSRRWINLLLNALPNIDNFSANTEQIKMLNMFIYTVFQKFSDNCKFASIQKSILKLKQNFVLFNEILELLKYNLEKIDFIDEVVINNCPLDLHCNYSRDQILVAFDFKNPSSLREGVKYLPKNNCDIFFITLNKSDKDYSPTTMYDDYSINEMLFHWQSQSTTSENSKTGQRYINHKKTGHKILLFVREYRNDLGGTSPYTFLGLGEYVSHQGSRPMNIVWRLLRPIPAKFLKKTNKLIVG